MKNLFYCTIIILLLFAFQSCDSNNSDEKNTETTLSGEDNILDFVATERYQTLDPIKVVEVTSFQVTNQLYECLVRFDEEDLTVKPMLVSFWEENTTEKSITFFLNKGVFFHDNACFEGGKGRELKASDVVYTFQRICSLSEGNYAYTVFNELIVGANDFYEGKSKTIGVEAIDDYTVKFSLTKTAPNFLQLLCVISSAIVAKEAVEANAIVGTGPFVYSKENDTENSITLLKNSNYHLKEKGNNLPYLSGVRYTFATESKDLLANFKANKIDILENIPVDEVADLVKENISDFQNEPIKYLLVRNKELLFSYINMNTKKAPFNDIKVRKAFAMAIDKSRIVDKVLKGEAFGPAYNGIVPPVIKDYDYESVLGLEFNVEKAQKLLEEAGFKKGEGFPKIEIVSNKSNTNIRLALELQKQLKINLGINAEITSMSMKEALLMKGGYTSNIVISSWLAETPDPLNFLSILYGGFVNDLPDASSYPNDSRYKNEAFDKAYKEALQTTDAAKRYELCLIADQIAANDVPIIPLWYYEKYQLVQNYVKNFKSNAMRIHFLPYVKIEKETTPQNKIETH